jgi:peptidoglycan/LPS O-acetylase OafA/YrhL
VAYFGLFFFVGWWLHRRRHQLAALHGWLKTYSALALVAFLTFGACRLAQAGSAHALFPGLKLLGLAAASLYAWLMIFVTTGWFLRFAWQHRPWVRYLADASYWWYFVHLPLVLWLQVIVSRWPLNAFLKFAFIIATTVIVLVATYHGCVRSTWIGRRLFSTRTGAV